MFADRVPDGLEGWTKKQTRLLQDDPNAEPFVTVISLDSKKEGAHRNIIVGDDLEGADSDESDVPQKAAHKFWFEDSIPLLVEPAASIKLLVGTQWGQAPVVARAKEDPGVNKVWWMPWTDENDKTRWPERFPQSWVDMMRARAKTNKGIARLVATQYDLLPMAEGHGYFDADKLRENCYERRFVPVEKMMRHVVRYPVDEVVQIGSEWVTQRKMRQADYGDLRYTLHADPAHREVDERLSDTGFSGFALTVVGTSEDWHFHVVDSWIKKDVSREEFLAEMFRMYVYWAPYVTTFEAVGAQSWLPTMVKLYEDSRRVSLRQLPTPWRHRSKCRMMPRMSARLEPSTKTNQRKEEYIMGQLETPVEAGWLHLNEKQVGLLKEFEDFGRADGTFDGLDALAQGPDWWKPNMTKRAVQAAKKRAAIREMIEAGRIYRNPLETPGVVPRDTEVAKDGLRFQ